MIIGPVIRLNGVLYGGASYHRGIISIYPELRNNGQRGFITDDGEFLTRKEAALYVGIHKQKLSEFAPLAACEWKLHSCSIKTCDVDLIKIRSLIKEINSSNSRS